MDNNPLISIIVPVYKVADYLDSCVKCLVNQTDRNLEIILVDDGSPDSCSYMCDDWASMDSRIQVIHKLNGGLSDARNAGLHVAKGEYISFADSDDLVAYRFVMLLYEAIRQTGADLAACDVEEFTEDSQIQLMNTSIAAPLEFDPQQALSQLIVGEGFRAVAWNKLYNARLLADEKFEYGRIHEDEFFSYRIYDKCDLLAFVDIPMYKYRQRQNSIMTGVSDRHLDTLDAHLMRLNLFRQKYPDLYYRDKITFCTVCLNLYQLAIAGKFENEARVKKKIKQSRRRISFTGSEFMRYSIKQKFYLLASMPCLIGLFSRLKPLKG